MSFNRQAAPVVAPARELRATPARCGRVSSESFSGIGSGEIPPRGYAGRSPPPALPIGRIRCVDGADGRMRILVERPRLLVPVAASFVAHAGQDCNRQRYEAGWATIYWGLRASGPSAPSVDRKRCRRKPGPVRAQGADSPRTDLVLGSSLLATASPAEFAFLLLVAPAPVGR